MAYWYNLRTRQVEADLAPDRARSADLMGPYDTPEEAEQALEKAQARTAAWDEEDEAERAWREGEAPPPEQRS